MTDNQELARLVALRDAMGAMPYGNTLYEAIALAERQEAEIKQARRIAEYWKAEHLAANAEIEALRKLLRDAVEDRSMAEYSLGLGLVEAIDAKLSDVK